MAAGCFTTNPETELEVERLCTVLRDLPIRGLASYAELSMVAGHDVRTSPFTMMKARRRVENETGMRFDTVRTKGITKLDGHSVIGIGMHARAEISRKARRQSDRLADLSYNDIDRDMQSRIDAERSLLGAIGMVATTKRAQIEGATRTAPILPSELFGIINRDKEK